MKFTCSILILLNLFLVAKAQSENALPVDERGKFIYYEVVEKKLSADLFNEKVAAFIKKQGKNLKSINTQGDTMMMAKGKLVINKTLLVMSRPSGEVVYNFIAETKGDKYRFWLTDFEFIPYMRDRYGNFVPSTTVGVPLENNPGKLNAGEWAAYKTQTFRYAKDFALQFKNYLAEKQATVVKPVAPKVVKKEWK